jgi:hypothetical protein
MTAPEYNQQKDPRWWVIGGDNIEAIYGWGYEHEAQKLCAWWNDHSKNTYWIWPMSQEQYEEKKIYLEEGDLGCNMDDELIAIAQEDEDEDEGGEIL